MNSFEEDKKVVVTPWEDSRSVNESYSSDTEVELYCEYLGKMRQAVWNVI
ncbi:MAG: hypothetical protein KH549_05475 [Clostridium sp.]|nr:hypothetical protein [Clostridium sp.]